MTHQTHLTIDRLYVERQRRDQLLCGAGARHLSVMVTRYGGKGWMVYRSRFVACEPDRDSLFIEIPRNDRGDGHTDFLVGEQIGCSFRRGRSKCLFTTVVIEPGIGANGQRAYPNTITLRWPENLQEMQRRLYERIAPPPDQRIDVCYWPDEPCLRPPDPCDSPSPASLSASQPPDLRRGLLEDLSAGGLSVLVTEEPRIKVGDVVACAFSQTNSPEPLQFHARLRHLDRIEPSCWTLGFQFVGLESSTEGHCRLAQLATIVSGYRRARLSTGPTPLPAGTFSR